MSRILVSNLSEHAHQALRRQAAKHKRSLEGEVRAILEAAALAEETFVLPPLLTPGDPGGKSLAQLVSEGRR